METGLNFDSDSMWIALRLAAALLAGAILGINRDLHRKPAGLRTLSLVSLGSALMVIGSLPDLELPAARAWVLSPF
jgi:putative Mg2+ transporter-C (MgtC) family protein